MGTQQRKQREREQRKRQIIKAAEKVFFNKGFTQSTIAEIAEAAELSKGTLYLYFRNKNELCLAIILKAFQLISKLLSDLLVSRLSGLEMVERLPQLFINFSQQYPDYYRSLHSYHIHHREVAPGSHVLQQCQEENRKINQTVIDMVEKGRADGSIRPDCDPVKISYAIWNEQTGFLPHLLLSEPSTLNGLPVAPERIVEYIFELIGTALAVDHNKEKQ